MRNLFFVFFVILAFSSGIFAPKVLAASNHNMVGNWVLALNHEGNVQMHDMVISSQDQDGNLSGTGGYPRGETYSITWTLRKSRISQDNVDLSIYYDNSDYVVNLSGKFQPDGLIAGNWKDNRGLQGKWGAVAGKPINP